jgi:hypothetical protein
MGPRLAAAALLTAALLLAASAAGAQVLGPTDDPGERRLAPGGRPYPYPPAAPALVAGQPTPAPPPPWWSLTQDEQEAAREIAERYAPFREAVAGRTYQLTFSPMHDAGQKTGAGVHARFEAAQTIETDWPGGWPFGGRYRMLHVTELIALVDLRRGEVVRLFCGPVCEREPDLVTGTLRALAPLFQLAQLLFGSGH